MNEEIISKNNNLEFVSKNPFVIIAILVLIALSVRLFYTNFEIPLALDALEYFVYAIDSSRLGHLPAAYTPSNNGWPIFLAIIFSIFQFENGQNFMHVQKISSIIFSSLTVIPIYYLIKQFFENKYAFLGASIFVFEPRIIINSTFGIADPLYIFLISISLAVVFNKKFALLSFGIASLATMVRPEGLFLFLGVFIMYIIKYKKEEKIILKGILAVFIFLLILSPMMIYKIGIYEDDRIFGRAAETIEFHSKPIEETNGNSGFPFIQTGLENFPKYLAWSMTPIFIILVPLGTIILFKEWKRSNFLIISPIISMSIPLFYVYSIPILETRYTYVLFPIFCVLSIFFIKKIIEKYKFQKILMTTIFVSIIFASFIFLEYKKIDYDSHEKGIEISKLIFNQSTGINNFESDRFVKSIEVLNNWPKLPNTSYDGHILSNILKIPIEDSESIEDYIIENKENGLTHIIIDRDDLHKEIQAVYYNENEYKFLEKKYEIGKENGKNHVKIFEINFIKLEN